MKIKEKEFENILNELKALAEEMGIRVRYELGDFKGGYCILKSSKVVVLNKRSNLQRKVITLSSALKELGVEEVYMPPKIREIIDELG